MTGFAICVAAIQPFDNSSMPVKTIPDGLSGRLGNQVYRYDSKILKTITHPQMEAHAYMLLFNACDNEISEVGSADISAGRGLGSRKPVITAEAIRMIQRMKEIIGETNAVPAIPNMNAGPALLQ